MLLIFTDVHVQKKRTIKHKNVAGPTQRDGQDLGLETRGGGRGTKHHVAESRSTDENGGTYCTCWWSSSTIQDKDGRGMNATPHVVRGCLCLLRSMLQVPPRVPPNMYNNDFTLPARCTVPSAASLAAFNVAKALFKTEGERTPQRKNRNRKKEPKKRW